MADKEKFDGIILTAATQMTTLWVQKQTKLSVEQIAAAFSRFHEVVNSRVNGESIEIEALREEGFEPVGAKRWANQYVPHTPKPVNPNFGKPLSVIVDMGHLKQDEELCPGG